jgi:hypothetical protein
VVVRVVRLPACDQKFTAAPPALASMILASYAELRKRPAAKEGATGRELGRAFSLALTVSESLTVAMIATGLPMA